MGLIEVSFLAATDRPPTFIGTRKFQYPLEGTVRNSV
jgi:hypothetical protein